MSSTTLYSNYYVGLRRSRIEEDPSLDEYCLDVFQGEDDYLGLEEMTKLLQGIRDGCDAALAALKNK